MLNLTKIKRAYIIDHVMPSDLDKNNIKHGLALKEKMIAEMTDDYVKSIIPDWKQIERSYRRRGISEYMDKITCGEMSFNDVPKTEPVQLDSWLRYKPFNSTFIDEKNMYDFDDCDYMDKSSGYTEWIKNNEYNSFNLTNCKDIMVHMKIAIIGDESPYYYPLQDTTHVSGWEFIDDELGCYDCSTWDRISETDNHLTKPVSNQEEYYRLFFRNRLGYPVYNWFLEDEEWNNRIYPGKKVRTIFCDPFRVVYTYKPNGYEGTEVVGSQPSMSGHQFLKTKHITEMTTMIGFNIVFDNLEIKGS